MKKRFILMTGLVLLLLGASNGTASEKRIPAQKKIYSFEYERKKAEVDSANKQFLREINQDIKESLNLDLNGFEETELSALFQNDKYKELAFLTFDVMNEQETGDVQPTLYKSENNILIMYKKADGSNVVHKYKFDNEKKIWEKVQKEKAQGSIIIHPMERVNDPPTVNKMNLHLRSKFHSF